MLRAMAAALGYFVLSAPAHAQVILNREDLVNGAVTPAAMAARAEENAREASARYPGHSFARTAGYDIAWPAAGEDTGGYAVVLVAAQSHVAAELPIRRAYIQTGTGREIELQGIGGEPASVASDGLAASVFGPFAEYSFYWAPADEFLQPGAILVDFATGRSGFRMGELPLTAPDWLREQRSEAEPNIAALTALREREFPGFAPLPANSR